LGFTPFPFATRALRANRVVAPCHRPWPAAEATAAVEECGTADDDAEEMVRPP